MSIQSIGTMESMLIGVSFMKGAQADLLKKTWEKRFTGNALKAILVNGNEAISEIYDNLCDRLLDMKIEEINGQIIVAVFLDFTDDHQAALAADMDNLQADIEDLLAKNVFEFLVFDYVGAYRREFRGAGIRQELRDRIQKSIYSDKRTFLVGRNPLTREEESWKGEMALLDVLSRAGEYVHAHFMKGTFGFLRYRDSNQDRRNQYVRRMEQLNRLLGDHGEEELRRNLEMYMEQYLKQPIMETCKPVSGCYPVPRELLSAPPIWGNAIATYENNVAKTVAAINETAKSMEDYMQAMCRKLTVRAGDILSELMERSEVGIELMQNMQAGKRIFDPGKRVTRGGGISLNEIYNVDELQEEISRFLDDMYAQALSSVCVDFVTAIGEAYKAISPEEIKKRKQQYEEERTLLTGRLEKLPEINSFCREVLAGRHFESAFYPRNVNLESHENRSLLFGRDEIYREIEKNGYNNMVQPFYYKPISGYESAEALSTFMYSRVNEQLEDILRELIAD